MTARKMKLGVSASILGYHVAAWRHPDAPALGAMDLHHHVRVVQTAERGLFDIYFLADAGGGTVDLPKGAFARRANGVNFEPITLLSALAMVTQKVGLVGTVSTTFNEPYHIARRFASLDHISAGRAGWNVVTSTAHREARKFGHGRIPDYDTRYERARECVDVVCKLWNSWEPDAFVRNKETGIFYDEDKRHPVNQEGKYFNVSGVLNVAPSPQGRPVIVQAGASEQGQELAAETADVVYAASQTLDEARSYYTSVKDRMHKYGRFPGQLKILPGIMPVVAATQQEAEDKYEQLQQLVDPILGLNRLAEKLGDLSGYDLDGPVPEPEDPVHRSRARLFVDLARRENLTIRQLYMAVAGGNGHRRVIGTPAGIADAMEEWFKGEAADGFNILPTFLPGALEDFVDLVVPELQRRGLFRTSYAGSTLREHLALD